MKQAIIKPSVILALATLHLVLSTPSLADHLATQVTGEIGIIGGSVSRSAFTEAVVNHEPKQHITDLSNTKQFLYYFTELKGMAGQTVIHRWRFDGTTMADTKFNIGAPRWRVWSNITLKKEWLGRWEVQVIDEMGRVVHSSSFNYIQADSAPGR